jgi:hypothetical protein
MAFMSIRLLSLPIFLSGCVSSSQVTKEKVAPVQTADERLDKVVKEKEALICVISTLKPEAFEDVGLYRIKPGDTALRIAYAHGLTLADFEYMNPGVEWRRLKVWQVVRIRTIGESAVTNQSPDPAPASVPPVAGQPPR